jgi:hypothetical protein
MIYDIYEAQQKTKESDYCLGVRVATEEETKAMSFRIVKNEGPNLEKNEKRPTPAH